MQEGGAFPLKMPALKTSPLTAAAKGVATKAAGQALTTAKAAAQGAATKAAGQALTTAKTAAGATVEAARQKAELEAGKAALGAMGATPAQLALAERGTGMLGGVSKAKEAFTSFTGGAALFFAGLWAGMKENWGKIAIVVVLIGLVIGLYMYFKKPKGGSDAALTAAALAATGKKEGFQDAAAAGDAVAAGLPAAAGGSIAPASALPSAPPEEELTLVNSQAKTIKQAGYAGPPTGGKFDPETITAQALKAGFRAFVLQIDYLKTEMDKAGAFPEPGVPTLLYRDDAGTLTSANAGSIETVAKTIASLAFRPESPDYTSPVILYLHLLATPSPVRAQEEYMRFLSRIARALNPLAPFHLGSTPMGIFTRQKRERELLHTPLKALEGQVLVLCNADTSIFRAPLAGGKRYDPADDLDYWVNMRVYLGNEDEQHGVAKIAEKEEATGGPAAIITSLDAISRLGSAKRDAFAVKGKGHLVIAMPGAAANPAPKQLDAALKDLGVNMVPLDIFGVPLEESKPLVAAYEGKSYKSKPTALRART
jgi:hypothetical protein